MTRPLRPLRIATRGSPMALHQAALVRDRLAAAHPELAGAGAVELVPIRTTGDRVQDRRLVEIGGKGLFTREIEEGLRSGRVDLAVHSLKDMETWLPDGLEIACVLPRDDPRDALISRRGARLAELPKGARIGTSSLRRQAQLLRHRPDVAVAPIRGNADTRLRKLAAGEFDAIVLALAGLARLGEAHRATEILPCEIMLPAVGQGVLAVECRAADARLRRLLEPLHDPKTAACTRAERAMLAALDGSCRTPIAGLATLDGDRLRLDALLLQPDGSGAISARRTGAVGDAEAIGSETGRDLRRRAGADYGFG
jgi:hydroxymethylbilane synthase